MEHEEEEGWNSKPEGYSPHRMEVEGKQQEEEPDVRATLPSALNVINASSVGKLVQLVTASRLILNHEGRVDPMKDECHYQNKH